MKELRITLPIELDANGRYDVVNKHLHEIIKLAARVELIHDGRIQSVMKHRGKINKELAVQTRIKHKVITQAEQVSSSCIMTIYEIENKEKSETAQTDPSDSTVAGCIIS